MGLKMVNASCDLMCSVVVTVRVKQCSTYYIIDLVTHSLPFSQHYPSPYKEYWRLFNTICMYTNIVLGYISTLCQLVCMKRWVTLFLTS